MSDTRTRKVKMTNKISEKDKVRIARAYLNRYKKFFEERIIFRALLGNKITNKLEKVQTNIMCKHNKMVFKEDFIIN